ncbi:MULTISPECIES: hypothetical protein [Vibrio]|uniref:hypothetical protein n=1 Tax=Vibrio TaxID=662 RepID=UPI0004DF55D1|nr:hypothetical protein [Vibrio parahaemolyticus]EGQ9239460.1 hypothetical protein [Vibrio vulnificus]EHD1698102.1 hypothetical protein [Vibrio vulnificus]EKZ9225831.1 hypothetical protein [Vibrio vulnificus]ELC9582673.1 hypothetical protein [Vibrio vulnificus]MCU8149790.1 hypothetical protein [Vibrio vulnificus]
MSQAEPQTMGVIPIKQRFVISVFLVASALLPFLGLIPFIVFIFILIYCVRSLTAFDAKRGANVLPVYLRAIRSASVRMLAWLLLSFFVILSGSSTGSSIVVDGAISPKYASVAFVFILSISLHLACLARILFHMVKGRVETQGNYSSLLLAWLLSIGGFFEKCVVRLRLWRK